MIARTETITLYDKMVASGDYRSEDKSRKPDWWYKPKDAINIPSPPGGGIET